MKNFLHNRAWSWLIAAIALLATAQLTLARDFTYSYEKQNLKFTVISEEDKTCAVVRNEDNVYLAGLKIPATASDGTNEYTVTAIKYRAFDGCSELIRVEIPTSVTSIGEWAFQNCSNLSYVEIPASVTSIGSQAFANNKNLNHVIYNSEVNSSNIFKGCKIYWLELGCTIVGDMFKDISIDNVEMSNSVTSIGERAFENCTGLSKVEISNSVTSIGEYAFAGCTKLGSIVIPNSVTSIGRSTFENCTNLAKVDIPNSVTSIGSGAFNNCTDLTWVDIPNSVTSIGEYAFSGCKRMQLQDIPNAITSIGKYAFRDCAELESLVIPNTITSIGEYAFSGCRNIKSIVYNSDVKPGDSAFRYCTFSHITFGGTCVPEYFWSASKSYTFGKDITSIDASNISSSTSEQSFIFLSEVPPAVILPQSQAAKTFFSPVNCQKSTVSIVVPCKSLVAYATAPDYENFHYWKTNEEGDAYNDGNYSYLTVPELEAAFIVRNGKSYTAIDIPRRMSKDSKFYTVKGILPGAFANSPNLTTATFGKGNALEYICAEAFKGCTALKEIELPETITTIGKAAFENCSALTGFDFPPLVTEISAEVLMDCKKLTAVAFPEKYTSINNYAFSGCNELHQAITIPAFVTRIGEFAFSHVSVPSIVIEDSQTPLETADNPFYSTDNLYIGRDFSSKLCTSVVKNVKVGNLVTAIPYSIGGQIASLSLGSAVQTIGKSVFKGALTEDVSEVVIPPSVTEIGEEAFANNKNLKSVKMGCGVTSIGAKAFDGDTALENVYITSLIPPTAADNSVFSNYHIPLYVVPGTMQYYEDSTPCWYRFYDEGSISEQTPVAAIKATAPSMTVAQPGDTFKITASVEPADATLQQLFFVSSNPDIAPVDLDGTVTIKEPKSNEEGVQALSEAVNDCEISVYSMYADVPPTVIKLHIISGIEDVVSPSDKFDPSLPYEVYNLSGMMAGTDKTNLAPGIYIVRQGGKTHKIAVR